MGTPSIRPRTPGPSRLIRRSLVALRLPYGLAFGLAFYAFLSGLGSAASLILIIEVGLRVTGSDGGAAVLGLDLESLSLGALFASAVAAASLVLLVDLLAAHQSSRIIRRVQLRLRTTLFDAYSEAEWVTQAADPPGHLQDVMASNVSQALILTTLVNSGLVALMTLATMVLFAMLISPVATSILIVALGSLIAALTPLTRVIRAAAERRRSTNLDHAVHLAEVTGLSTEVRTFGVAEAARARHAASARAVATAHGRLTWLEKAVPALQRNLALLSLLGVLAVVYQTDIARVGELGAVVVLLGRSLSHANAVQQTLNRFAAAGPFVLALDDEIRRYTEHADTSAGRPRTGSPAADPASAFSLRAVTYRYPDSVVPALEDISLDVPAGTYLAIVGPSGSGKTTLAEILLALRRPDRGTYVLGAIAAANGPVRAWRSAVAYVPQRPNLLVGTIAENVRFLRDDISDGEVEAALREAGLLDLLADLPAGSDTMLGPGEHRLSGGQLQRLAIARALAGHPKVIVFDEPTSALDPDAEFAIRSTFRALAGSVTLVVIAHRATTIEGCDRVIVLEQGRVVADGTPSDVAATSEFWKRGFESLDLGSGTTETALVAATGREGAP